MKTSAFAALALCLSLAAPGLAAAQSAKLQKPPPVNIRVGQPPDAAARRAQRVDRMFRIADRNRDGVVSRGEYRQWYRESARRRGPLTWKKHAEQIFRKLDASGFGRLSRAEFGADPSFQRVRPGWAPYAGVTGAETSTN